MMMVTPRQKVSPFLNLAEDVEQGIGDALDYLEDSFETTNILPSTRIGLTPLQYTPVNNTNRPIECNSKKKRVEFSPWTKYLSAPTHQDQNSDNPQSLKSLPSTRPTKFVKSILKSHNNSSPLQETDHNIVREYVSPSQKIDTFGGMLDTVVEQLASNCLDMRLDAYIVIQGALRAFDYNVDKNILSRKAKILQSFLKRDITAPGIAIAIQNQLTVQALKTVMALLRNVVFQDCIEDCFGAFLLDRSVAVLTDELASKQIVTHHLQVLALQRFSRKIMNVDRVERILSALVGIEKRCRGSNVVGARLLIYQRLLAQNKPIMVARVSEWIKDLFDGIFCSVKEVRNRSIDIGVNIALLLSGNNHCVRAVLELFDREVGSGMKYATFVTNILSERLTHIEETPVIPQIWVIPVLFLRCRRGCLEQWKYLKLWLSIIQKCMAIGDLRTRISAYHAWNQFVWAVDPNLTTTDTIKSLLLRPIFLGLERSAKDKVIGKARIIYLNSYCNLLYYSLRPGSTFDHLDTYWARYAQPVLEKMAVQGTKEASRACCILASLFRTNKSYTWDENRANESRRFHIEELPQLDPKWIRLRMKSIVKTISICFSYASWNADADVSPPLQRMWTALMEALAEAGSKEINASMELKDALAQILNLLHEVWDTITTLGDAEGTLSSRISHFSFLIETSICILKPSHFLTPVLLQALDGCYKAAPSTSKTLKGAQGQLAPLTEILSWLQTSPIEGDNAYNDSLISSAKGILQTCCDSQASRRMLISRLLQVVHVSGKFDNSSPTTAYTEAIWLMLVEIILSADDAGSELAIECSESSIGNSTIFLNTVQSGLRFGNPATSKVMQDLFGCYADHVKSIAGDDGLVVAIIEPLAAVLLEEESTTNVENRINLCNNILTLNSHPHSRRSVEKAAQLLSIPYTRQKRSQFDPYENLSNLIMQVLKTTYELSDQLETEGINHFLNYLSIFINSIPLSQVAILLRKVQDGLVLWIADSEMRLKSTSGQFPDLLRLIGELWSKILFSLQRIPKKNSMLLSAVDDLIAAGFASSCEDIVSQTVEFWNSSFGLEDSLEYSEKVVECLSTLRTRRQLLLPNFPLDAGSGDSSIQAADNPNLGDESDKCCQENPFDIAEEEPKPATEMILSVSTEVAHSAETIATEIQPTTTTRRTREGSDMSDKNETKGEAQNYSATGESEVLLSQQSQLDSQLLTENQSDACEQTSEQPDPEEPANVIGDAETVKGLSTRSSTPEHSVNEKSSCGDWPRIASGTFFREFNRLHGMNDRMITPLSSLQTESMALDEDVTDIVPQGLGSDTKGSVLVTSGQVESDSPTKDIAFTTTSTSTSTSTSKADGAITASIEKEKPSEDRLLIEKSTFVSSTLPSSDIDAVMVADSLLLPSRESHDDTDRERERFSTPLESTDVIDSSSSSSSVVDASTPWQAYLNSSPPTSMGNDGGIRMVHREIDNMHDNESLPKLEMSGQNLPNYSCETSSHVQKFSVEGLGEIEDQNDKNTAETEESSTINVEDPLIDMNTTAVEKEFAASIDVSMMGSPKNCSSLTRKRSSDFIEYEDARKKLKQDDPSAMHTGLDSTQPDLASVVTVDVCEEGRNETSRALMQDLSPMKLESANSDVPEDGRKDPPLGSEGRDTLKRRRSRRFEVDIEHVQLSTPKRRKRSTTAGSIEHIRVPSVEQESETPCEAAALLPAKYGNESNDDQGVAVDDGEARRANEMKNPMQNLGRKTDEETQEIDTTHIDPKANSNDRPISASLLKFPISISPSHSSTPSSSQQSTPSRTKAKPRSIMGRLRRVLSDCKQLVLGSQEEREFDDVLFEVRKEVHEAGRRGRDSSGGCC